jgi:hypothetical protein
MQRVDSCLIAIWVATKETTISNTDDRRLTTLVNSASRFNSAADWSAAKGEQVLPHFQQIVSGGMTPPCPIATVF